MFQDTHCTRVGTMCLGKSSIKIGAPGGTDGKESVCSTGDLGLIPVLGREGNGNPLQYSCLENPMVGGAC